MEQETTDNEEDAIQHEGIPMPSLFKSLRCTNSAPLKNVIDLEYYIFSDSYTQTQTEKYREALKIDRQWATNLKRNSHAICPSIQFSPKGRTIEYFEQETYWLMLDYDDVEDIVVLEEKFKLIRNSPYTMVEYRTISGKGLRILLRYERPSGCILTATELHRLAIEKAMNYYNELTSLAADRQCKDMTRLCGLAHDENAYFNWKSQPLHITHEEVDRYYRDVVKPQMEKTATSQPTDAHSTHASSGNQPSFEDIIEHVRNASRQWDCKFEAGSHHKFALRFAVFCHNFGADKEDLLAWMLSEMGSEMSSQGDEIKDIVDWVYNKQESFGSWHLYARGEGYGKNPDIKTMQQWLNSRAEIRFNTMTHKNELRSFDVKSKFFHKWTTVEDREENTIFSIMDMDGLHISQRKLHSFINSKFSEDFNPLEDYLQSLPKWEEGSSPDYIKELCDRVTVKDAPEYFHTHEWFLYSFRKWIVGMVVGWLVNKVVNETVLILVGKGGIYKTTFLDHMLPPQLSQYFTNDSSADYKSKDFLEYIASKALVCLDEFDAPYGKNLNSFKSCVTKKEINVRYPYDRYASLLIHHASLCGTSNNIHIINEQENRRYLVWQVEYIESPVSRPFNYEGIYSQALALGKKVLAQEKGHDLENEWVYWLTDEDRKKQEIHNQMFLVNNYMEERINKYFRVPKGGTSDEEATNLIFVTASDILDKICTNPVFRQTFSNKDVNAVMERLGFTKRHTKLGNGWWVIENDGETINRNAKFIHNSDTL